jgi:hypothetical protein
VSVAGRQTWMAGLAVVSIAIAANRMRLAGRPEARTIAFAWSHLFERERLNIHKSRTQHLLEGGLGFAIGLAILGELAGEFLGWR